MPLPDNILRRMEPSERKQLGRAGWTYAEIMRASAVKMEKDLQRQIGQYLRMHGIEFINPPMRERSKLPEGWPDFTFVYRVPLLLEAKLPGKEPSPEQLKIHERLRDNGWWVYVVTSMDEVRAVFRLVESYPCNVWENSSSVTHQNELVAKAITEKVCKRWQELEGRYGEEAGFETKTSILMEVIGVLEKGVEC